MTVAGVCLDRSRGIAALSPARSHGDMLRTCPWLCFALSVVLRATRHAKANPRCPATAPKASRRPCAARLHPPSIAGQSLHQPCRRKRGRGRAIPCEAMRYDALRCDLLSLDHLPPLGHHNHRHPNLHATQRACSIYFGPCPALGACPGCRTHPCRRWVEPLYEIPARLPNLDTGCRIG